MDLKIILSVKHHGQTKLIGVTDSSSYAEFVGQLLGKWSDLEADNFTCCCECGSSSNICLDSEEDLQNLLVLCSFSDVRIVSVAVCKKNVHTPLGSNGTHDEERSVSSREEQSNLRPTAVQYIDELTSCHISKSDDDMTTQHNIKKRQINSGQFVEWSGEDRLPSYDICPPVKRTCLLSDSWSDIFKEGVGSIFTGGAAEFRTELIKYSAQMGFKFKYKKNTARYINVICGEDDNSDCDWFIRTRRQPVTLYFEITKANFLHKCIGKMRNSDSSRICPRIIGNLVLNNMKNRPNTSGQDIVKEMKTGYGLEVPYWKAHRAAQAARDQIYERYVESYDQLRWYCEAIIRTNPGSIVSLEYNHISNHFERVFISFKACIEGFKFCRPMLFIDGTFMKGRAKGTMLTATAKDGDNGLFPVAFAVVSAENEDNWAWFLRLLRENLQHEKQIFYISDRNTGLMAAFPLVFDEPVHFYCLYHLINNLKGCFSGCKTEFRKKIVKFFRDAAYAPNKRIFEEKFKQFKLIGGEKVDKWLTYLHFENWAVAHSPNITRYGEMTSNAVESFNAWIKEERSLPITHMIESIRTKLTRWYVERRETSEKWTTLLVPTKHGEWHYSAENSRTWYVLATPSGDYQVCSTPSVRVDLSKRTCTCHQWQVTGFPCVHAVAAICRRGDDVKQYIDECYLKAHYGKCYKANLNLIPETERFEYEGSFGHNKILPPKLNRPIGRPKKNRIASYGEFPKK